MPNLVTLEITATSMFAGVTSDLLSGALDEIKALVPVALPVVIGYAAFRKGWSFLLKTILHA